MDCDQERGYLRHMNESWPDLSTTLTKIALFNHEHVESPRVRRTGYLLHQHLRYEYPGPIYDLKQRLMILPTEQHGDQRRIDYRLDVSSAHFSMFCQEDTFGNKEIMLAIPQVEQAIAFETWILIERKADNAPHYLPAHWLTDMRLLAPSALTKPDDALRLIAASLLLSGLRGLALAKYINQWVYQTVHYTHDVTTIHTTAAEVLTLKQGVCQDYAHLMLTLCRLCGLPSRYVSGHMQGEGGTHAWVEVLLPVPENSEVALVVPFDPTHGRSVGLDYITVSVGRDYYDVAPTSGTFRASYHGQLTTHKKVSLTLLEYAE